MTRPVAGDTVRLEETFKDADGTLYNPSGGVVVEIYDDDLALVTTVSGASVTNPSTGVYRAFYTIPAGAYPPYYYVFKGTTANGPELDRRRLDFAIAHREGEDD